MNNLYNKYGNTYDMVRDNSYFNKYIAALGTLHNIKSQLNSLIKQLDCDNEIVEELQLICKEIDKEFR